jgi:hypothetical protein
MNLPYKNWFNDFFDAIKFGKKRQNPVLLNKTEAKAKRFNR